MMSILLKVSVSRTAHDTQTLLGQIHQRAATAIDEEIQLSIDKLESFQGPNPNHMLVFSTDFSP